MVRKTLYALIGISLVLVMNQILTANGTAATTTGGSTPIATSTMTGTVEVRVSASQTGEEVSKADVTISSVEIHLPDGWSKMNMAGTNVVDLKQVNGLEQTIATTNLSQGTYTQIRMTIARVDITLNGSQPKKASLSYSQLTFVQNFQVTAKNTTVLILNFDATRSIDDTATNKIIFKPTVNLLFTRTPGALEILTTNLPQAEAGVAYQAQMVAVGGLRPYSWSITMGDLPGGLTLNPVTGVISGTPTVAGSFGFLARVDDVSSAPKNTTRNYIVSVAVGGALQIVTGSLPDGTQKGDYKSTLQAVGGTKAYSWSVVGGKLPTGLVLDSSTGIISGTSTDKGDFSFVVQVTDSANPVNTDTQNLSIHIAPEVLTN